MSTTTERMTPDAAGTAHDTEAASGGAAIRTGRAGHGGCRW